MNLSPPTLDAMEIWEIGEAFGLLPDGTPDKPPEQSTPGQPQRARQVITPELLAERAQARAEGREPPLPPVLRPSPTS